MSGILLLKATPALLTMMSIWNLPSVAKADLTAATSVVAPEGVPRSACAMQARMLCLVWRDCERASVGAWEPAEV